MKTDNPIKLGVDDALKAGRFRRKSNTWYSEADETVLVVELQKSNFGEQFYINLGVLVKGVPANYDGRLPPKENQCHIRIRIEALRPDEEMTLKQLLDLDNRSITATERQQEIAKVITRIALPFLTQCSNRSGIQKAYRNGLLESAMVSKSIHEAVMDARPGDPQSLPQ